MNIASRFYQYFDVIEINDDKLLLEAFKLRYQVYAIEKKFPGFDPDKYPTAAESDEFDIRSLHSLLVHKPSGETAGTIRLVCADKSDPLLPFPVERHLDPINGFKLPSDTRNQVAEISRFILSSRFRSRMGEKQWIDGLSEAQQNVLSDTTMSPAENRRAAPHPTLGLIKSGIKLSWLNGINYWLAAMEPRLHRKLTQFGICLGQVSASIEYHGTVNVYFGYVPEVMKECHVHDSQMWEFLTDNGQVWPD